MTHVLYDTWRNMKQRCTNPKATGFRNYGGKGIAVCDRWLGRRVGFANFVADMGPKPTPEHTLERKNRNGPYSPENCIWASRREQMLNTSRTVTFERDGTTYKASDLAEQYGLNPRLVATRAAEGKSLSEIISRHHLEEGYVHMATLQAKRTAQQKAQTHCKYGHEFNGDNLALRKGGGRICRRCVADAQARYRSRKAT